MKNTNRKANWLSRKAHTALVMLNGTHGNELRSCPEIYQASGYQVGYSTFATGISELTALGIVSRNKKTVSFNNGFATRTFKGVVCNLSEDDYEYLKGDISDLYNDGWSVESVAAVATVAYIDSLQETVENNGWFSLKTYQKHLLAPSQKSKTIRAPSDAVGYVEIDLQAMMYRWKRTANYEIYEKIRNIDEMIESYKTRNKK